MVNSSLPTMVAVMAAAALAPIIGDHLSRWIRVPSVVLEIALGILIGPAVLGWAHESQLLSTVASFGLSMLMFLAGYEIDFQRVKGAPLKLAAIGWLVSTALGLIVGVLVRGPSLSGLVIGLALTTTALGTILPVVADANLLPTRFGARVLAVGAAGEFGPIVAVALLLTDEHPLLTGALIITFALIAAVGAWLAMRPRSPRLARMVTATLGTSVQLAVRLTMLVIVLMLWIADTFNLDVLLGAFAAGIIMRLFLSAGAPHETEAVESKLSGIGYGFLIPIFFVNSGMGFDLTSLLANPGALALIPGCLIFFVLIRGVPTFLLHHGDLPGRQPQALALFSSAALPLIVVITSIGVEAGKVTASTAAAMVAAGMLSVLIYPLVALRTLGAGSRTSAGYDVDDAL
jgi:Kef-type K+ transport system membrane component KefB